MCQNGCRLSRHMSCLKSLDLRVNRTSINACDLQPVWLPSLVNLDVSLGELLGFPGYEGESQPQHRKHSQRLGYSKVTHATTIQRGLELLEAIPRQKRIRPTGT